MPLIAHAAKPTKGDENWVSNKAQDQLALAVRCSFPRFLGLPHSDSKMNFFIQQSDLRDLHDKGRGRGTHF